ncbi:flap endonuclease-1 [Halococcoides cellulosivorans]|uniref:Flap endonuclease-1 n=1 Tax=Halococcoides cellulosivorans TaxID=1679096 RepID=A0A2R4WYM6_9EURY|nr:flap endonuclease-1 [Halococcoides cellulosivorans]AWB26649.1 flap endonuclease-1 [Halococcoides cellulosivorans]
MGNADLRDLAVLEPIDPSAMAGATIAIDAHNWLYRYLTTTVRWTNAAAYTTSDGREVAHLLGTLKGLPTLFEADLTPIFVFDGATVDMKDDEVADRRAARERTEDALEDAREAGDPVEIARLDSQRQSLSPEMIETTIELLDHLGVPVVKAPAEGEAQAAHMAATEAVDYVGTEDYDALLFGAPQTLRRLTSSDDTELMDLKATLDEHAISREQLIDVAILCGTDFNDGVSGYGPVTAVDAVREHGTLAGVFEAEDVFVEHADRIRDLFLDPPVTDDYSFDTSIDPDLEAARAFCETEWEIASDELDRPFERIEDTLVQTGLDQWG